MEDGREGVEGIAVTELMKKSRSRVDCVRVRCPRPSCSVSVAGDSVSVITESLLCSVFGMPGSLSCSVSGLSETNESGDAAGIIAESILSTLIDDDGEVMGVWFVGDDVWFVGDDVWFSR